MHPIRWKLTFPAVVFSVMQALSAEGPGLQTWPVDPLIKVFPDARPGPAGAATAEVARGEHASLQFVVYSEHPITGLRVELAELRSARQAATLSPRAPRFVGVCAGGSSHAEALDRPATPSACRLSGPAAGDRGVGCPGRPRPGGLDHGAGAHERVAGAVSWHGRGHRHDWR
ncbi:MAG: hypothetical protein M5U12_30915 [Verrucomicrobia bacterium]|nr:hypothetical protein [Verrucomicrobiota bacterium]